MPIYFLIGLTILILVIAVYATVVEEDEATPVDSISPSDWDAQTHEQQQEYKKAS